MEFPRKNHVEFPGVLAFWFFPSGVTQLWKIFRGEAFVLHCTKCLNLEIEPKYPMKTDLYLNPNTEYLENKK